MVLYRGGKALRFPPPRNLGVYYDIMKYFYGKYCNTIVSSVHVSVYVSVYSWNHGTMFAITNIWSMYNIWSCIKPYSPWYSVVSHSWGSHTCKFPFLEDSFHYTWRFSYPYLVIPVPEVPIFIFFVLCSADSPKPLHRWHRLVWHTQLCASECSGGAFFLNLMIRCGCLAEFNALAMIDKASRNTHCTDLHLVFCVRLLPSNREPLKWTGGGTARKSHRILHVLVY